MQAEFHPIYIKIDYTDITEIGSDRPTDTPSTVTIIGHYAFSNGVYIHFDTALTPQEEYQLMLVLSDINKRLHNEITAKLK